MGPLGELGGSRERWSSGQSLVHGSVQVERHVSKPCSWVQGRRSPLVGFSAGALPASNRRTVGQGSGGAKAPLVDGGAGGERKSPPARWGPGEKRISPVMGVLGEQERSRRMVMQRPDVARGAKPGSMPAKRRQAGRDATGNAQRVSLAKIACTTRTSCGARVSGECPTIWRMRRLIAPSRELETIKLRETLPLADKAVTQ